MSWWLRLFRRPQRQNWIGKPVWVVPLRGVGRQRGQITKVYRWPEREYVDVRVQDGPELLYLPQGPLPGQTHWLPLGWTPGQQGQPC